MENFKKLCEVCERYEHGDCKLCLCSNPDFVYNNVIHDKCRTCGDTVSKKFWLEEATK